MPVTRTNALILCVDDYENILAGWKMLLEREGYQALTAVDSNRAIDLFTSHSVDEVILDCQLPGVSGDVVARRMKAIKPGVSILMLSGDDPLPKEKLKPVEAFLFKADSITVFLDVVKTLLNICRPALNACAVPERSDRKSEEAMDEFGAAAQARAA